MNVTDSSWVIPFLGLPFEPCGRGTPGIDCWGLVCQVYQQQKGITLPLSDIGFCARKIATLAADEMAADQLGWRQISKPVNLCLVAMSARGPALHHVGVYLDDNGTGKVLHAVQPVSTVTRLENLASLGYHTLRFYEFHQPLP